MRDHLLRLDPKERRARFFRVMGDAAIEAHCGKIFADGGIVLGCFVVGVLRGIGELHREDTVWPTSAEVAFTVERPFRGCGIGTELLRRLIELARNRGIRTIHFRCLADNTGARKIARGAGGALQYVDGEIVADIAQPWPSFWSLLSEVVADGQAMLDGWLSDTAGKQPAGIDPDVR